MKAHLQSVLFGALGCLLTVGTTAGEAAQQQIPTSAPASHTTPSLADVARQQHALHKNQPRTDMIWTNDNLPGAGGISVVGQPPEQFADASPPPESEVTENEEPVPATEAIPIARPTSAAQSDQAKRKLEDAKQRLASLRIDVNLAQREFALDQRQFDSNPNRPIDRGGEEKLRDDSHQVEEIQQEVTAAENEVARLEQELSQELSAPVAN